MIRHRKINIITRRGNGIDFKGMKRSDAPIIRTETDKSKGSTAISEPDDRTTFEDCNDS